ncbi:MAG: hypothetical protein H6Q68_3776 [Firmicutes bacterium]|nr:hypothetical protein [Bacillota bacterium]
MSEFNSCEIAKRDAALEVMAAMLGTRARKKWQETSPEIIARIEAEEKILCWERDEIFKGNAEIIWKIITVYAKEIQEQRGWQRNN